jgi:hypothetical protein
VKSVIAATAAARETGELTAEMRVHETVGDHQEVSYDPSIPAKTERTLRVAVLAVVMLIAGTYTAAHIGKGWVPADDGALSQSALRVLQGQLPHRDFGEIYTGGLSFIHAFAFRMLGVNLMSLRICVFLFFLAWLPVVYYIALRFTSAVGAGAIALLAMAWSYPNYPAAMPSWYNLFFATFGAAALLRYLEVRTRRWLLLAGICGGASILIKVIGAYYIAGVLLFLAFLEQNENADEERYGEVENQAENRGVTAGWPFRLFSAGALLLFLAVLVQVLHARLGAAEIYHFVLPSTALVVLVLAGEWNLRSSTAKRFRLISRTLVPFLCGVAVPVIVFLVPYARSGSVWTFFSGVTASAVERSSGLGVVRPMGIEKLWYTLPLLGFLLAAMFWDKFQGKTVGTALSLGAAVIVWKAYQTGDMVNGIWGSVALLTPIVVLLGAAAVWRSRNAGLSTKLARQQVVLLIALAGTCTLVQFPFAAPIYLSYAIPVTLLALVAIVSTSKKQPGTYPLSAVVGLYMAFGIVCLVPHYIYEITWLIGDVQTMHEPRAGGLKIEEAVYFDQLSRFLREHSPNGLMYAGNDCPELYFLSGLKNVADDDTGESAEATLNAIRSENLNLVVINQAPFFPGAIMHPEVKAEVMKRFPHTIRFGIFQIFWKQ